MPKLCIFIADGLRIYMKIRTMEDKLRIRLLEFMAAKGLSVNSLSKVIGVQTRTLNNQVKTSTSISAGTLLEILFHYKDLSAEWLLRGVGSMYIKESERDIYETLTGQIRDDNVEFLRDMIRRQQREIDGLYERIAELKGEQKEPKRA